MNPNSLKHDLHYMYDYVNIIYAFVKFLDEPPVIICLPPGIVIRVLAKGSAEEPHSCGLILMQQFQLVVI